MTSKEECYKLFESFNNQKILVVGDVMIDSYLWGKVDRISPEAPVPVVAVKKRENRLGGAANVALNLKSLGAKPVLCSAIGDDSKGNEFIELLKNENLSFEGITKSSNRITTTKFRVFGNNSQLIRVDEEIISDLIKDDFDRLLSVIHHLMNKGDVKAIVFQDYNKGVLSKDLITKVIALANDKKIPVVVDPKKKNFTEFKNVSLFKPNLKELKEGLKMESVTAENSELKYVVDKLHKQQNIKTILTTLSEKGVMISTKVSENKFEKHFIPAHIRTISDVSGAGDTVISVATLCLVAGLAPKNIASISNLAGGIVCEEVGVVPINKERLFNEVLELY
ncbi:MAG: hypothetical protein K8R41_02020 [Bacteroidales bacterium]|nr:hypothetical protein [Bacteroidales bacterium]